MLTAEQLALLMSTKGQFRSLAYTRPVKLRKEFTGKPALKRVTGLSVRAGCSYDNIGEIHRRRVSGEAPAVNAGLSWGRWKIEPYVIEHGDKLYARFIANAGGTPPKVEYFYDGVVVTADQMKLMSLASEFKPLDLAFVVSFENILELA